MISGASRLRLRSDVKISHSSSQERQTESLSSTHPTPSFYLMRKDLYWSDGSGILTFPFRFLESWGFEYGPPTQYVAGEGLLIDTGHDT